MRGSGDSTLLAEVRGSAKSSVSREVAIPGRLKMHDLKMQDWKMTEHVN